MGDIFPRAQRLLSGAIALLFVISIRISPARAEEERSTGWAYASATAGVLVPAWTAQAIMPKDEEGLRWNARWVATLTGTYASLAWGTSLGYYYSGNTSYATWSGLGKTALLGAGLGAHFSFESAEDHAYLLALTTIAIVLWDVGDYVYLFRDVDKQNERRRMGAVGSALAKDPRSSMPRLFTTEDSIGVSFGGRF